MTPNQRREAGRRGGLATLAKHGKDHFSKIGKRGAATFWKRYKFEPTGLNDFAIVKRETREVIAFLSGRPF
ncbi:MAG TPA: hypothetical protein PKE23_04090 [Anaerolineales bacterium]|nr:hypothetical protein [Anaerolineales bacterium]